MKRVRIISGEHAGEQGIVIGRHTSPLVEFCGVKPYMLDVAIKRGAQVVRVRFRDVESKEKRDGTI